MTSAHILYIPTIFLLGFIAGLLIQSNAGIPAHVDQTKTSKRGISGFVVLSAFIVFLAVFIGTHFFDIPRSSKSIANALNGQEIFDKKPSYSGEEVYSRISNCPHQGLQLYREFTYTMDVLFPITLFIFLVLLISYVCEKSKVKRNHKLLVLIFPVLWFAADMIENAAIYHLLSIWPARNMALAGVLGYITITKFALLLVSLFMPALILILTKVRRRTAVV